MYFFILWSKEHDSSLFFGHVCSPLYASARKGYRFFQIKRVTRGLVSAVSSIQLYTIQRKTCHVNLFAVFSSKYWFSKKSVQNFSTFFWKQFRFVSDLTSLLYQSFGLDMRKSLHHESKTTCFFVVAWCIFSSLPVSKVCVFFSFCISHAFEILCVYVKVFAMQTE